MGPCDGFANCYTAISRRRHCERSEAIQQCIRGGILDCFAALAMTGLWQRIALPHRPLRPQPLDRRLVVSRATQNLVTVLADAGRLARLHFLGAVDPDRA